MDELLGRSLALGDLVFELLGVQSQPRVGRAQFLTLLGELVGHQAQVAHAVAACDLARIRLGHFAQGMIDGGEHVRSACTACEAPW